MPPHTHSLFVCKVVSCFSPCKAATSLRLREREKHQENFIDRMKALGNAAMNNYKRHNQLPINLLGQGLDWKAGCQLQQLLRNYDSW